MRKREVQRCQCHPVSSDCMFSFVPFVLLQKLLNLAASRPDSSNCHERDGGVDTTSSCTRADAHFSRAHITMHNSLIDPHSSNVVTSALAQGTRDECREFLKKHCHLFVMSLKRCACRSFHLLPVVCHDPQRQQPHWRRPD